MKPSAFSASLLASLFACLLFAAGFAVAAESTAEAGEQPQILGWIEHLRLMPGRALFKAKLDSGAKSSALHAEDLEFFELDGRQMVRFSLRKDHQDADSERIIYERPLVGEVNIKLRGTERLDARPVVRLEFCLAGQIHNTLFTLTDRSNFNYPVLLGRDFLKYGIVVDSSATFTHRTRCPRV
ncbi:MAG: ATP-dependent zinc protease [Pseudomonadales bacterium]|jgi:hypothetical protein|nr:ATP-dependent zinc protease [Pseudomonadales bacterium]